MAADEKDVIAWKKVWDVAPVFESEEEELEFKKFQRFYLSRQMTVIGLRIVFVKGIKPVLITRKFTLLPTI